MTSQVQTTPSSDIDDELPGGVFPPLPAWEIWLPYLTLAVAVFLAYINVYDNNFLFDDDLIIRMNENLRSWNFTRFMTTSTTSGAHIVGGFYRPLQMMSYYVIYQLGGETRFGFHFFNISLHAINACLAYALGRRMGFNPTGCFWAVLLWALHPIHTEAVAYMSATADPLYAMFSLICVLIVMPDFTLRKCLIATPVFVLALLAKETAAVVPALIVVTMFIKSNRSLAIKPYLSTWPLWVVSITFLVWRMGDISFDGPRRYALLYNLPEYNNLLQYSQHFSYRVYTFFATLPTYLSLLVWPVGLHMERNFPIFSEFWRPQAMAGAFMIAAALLYILECRGERGKPLSWGLLWFAAAHAPDTGVFVIGNSLLLEHWMYLPCIGLFLGIGESICLLLASTTNKAPKAAAIIICVALTGVLTLRTHQQNEVWQDAISFYTNIFKYGELSARAHNNMALAYMDRNDIDDAIDEFNKAIKMTDSYAETRHNLGLAYLHLAPTQENIEAAITNLKQALKIDPHFYRSDMALAEIYATLKDQKDADYYNQQAQQGYKFMRP